MAAIDYSRFGTRISLSDRFSLIRKEAQKRAILVNPTIDSPQVPKGINKPMKNFNGTVSRADRPSAALQQGSDRNKRLVYQMAVAPNVLAEIHQTYNPQIRAQLPVFRQAENIRNQLQQAAPLPPPRKSIRQRLGAAQNGSNVNNAKMPIKNRLGVKRKPISQRIGPKPVSNGLSNNRNLNGNQLRAKNSVAFKRKAQTSKLSQVKATKNLRGAKSLPAARKPIRRKPVTAQQLDKDLDTYMMKTKGYLNADLDAYMSQA